MDIVEEYIKKLISLSNLSKDEILKIVKRKKDENKGLTDIGALFMIKNELGLDFSIKPRTIHTNEDALIKQYEEDRIKEEKKKEDELRKSKDLERGVKELGNNIKNEKLREILISLRKGEYRQFEDLGEFDYDYVIFETMKIIHQKLLNNYGFKRDEYIHHTDEDIYRCIHKEDDNLNFGFFGFFNGPRSGFIIKIFSDFPYWKYREATLKMEYRIDIDYLKAVNTMISDLDQFMKDEVERTKQSMSFTNKGQDLAIQGKINQAIELYDKAIELNPENFFAFANRGLALMEIGKLEDAKFNFNVSMKNSNKEPSWLSKAEIMKISGENEKALHCYDKVLESKPNNINALFYKGLLLETLGNYKDALKYINRVLEINSDHHQATEAKKRMLKKS